MISIVIPLYNKEQSISNTIQSVLNQTFQEFEIVVVNDGSTDNSLKIVSQIEDPRIRIIDKPNGGVSSARNRGIKEARYEWIAFLDADDLWEKEKLSEVAEAIKNFPEIKWIIHAYKTLIGNREIKYLYKKTGVLNNIVDDLISGLKIHTSAVVVKKEVFLTDNRLYFREGINNSEDREVWYKLSLLYPQPYYVDKILSSYIIDKSDNSLTGQQSNDPKHFHFLEMQNRLKEVLKSSDIENEKKMISYIDNFNFKIIIGYWVNSTKFPEIFKEHLRSDWFYFLKHTMLIPKVIKKILCQVLRIKQINLSIKHKKNN